MLLSFHISDVPSQPVGPLRVDNITDESVDLSWQPPTSDGGSPIKNYLIEYKQPSKANWVKAGTADGLTTDFTVTGLMEGADYLFRVTAINDEGNSKPLESEKAVKPQKKIGKVYDFFLFTFINISTVYILLYFLLHSVQYCLTTTWCSSKQTHIRQCHYGNN